MEATFMALEAGHRCWCGNGEKHEYTRQGFGVCDTPCAGDEYTLCGESTEAKATATRSLVRVSVCMSASKVQLLHDDGLNIGVAVWPHRRRAGNLC